MVMQFTLRQNNVTHNIENSLFYSNGGSGVAAIYTAGNQMTLNILNCTIMDNDGTTCGGVNKLTQLVERMFILLIQLYTEIRITDIYRNGSTFNVTYSIYGSKSGSFNSSTETLASTDPQVIAEEIIF